MTMNLLNACAFLFVLCGTCLAFPTPFLARTEVSSKQFRVTPGRNVRVAGNFHSRTLRVSSSSDKEKDELQDSSQSDLQSIPNQDSQLIEWAIQGGTVLALALVGYNLASSVFAAASDMAASAVGALGDEFAREMSKIITSSVSLIAYLVSASWNGLLVVVPIIAKAIVSGVQAAIPVLKDASDVASSFAAPYVEEAKVEAALVAAPYVDHLKDVVHQATESTIVQPMQQLTRSVDAALVAPLQEAKDNLLGVVDATVVVPIQEVKDSFASAIDNNVMSPIQDVRDSVESNVLEPIQEAKQSLSSFLGMELPQAAADINDIDSAAVLDVPSKY